MECFLDWYGTTTPRDPNVGDTDMDPYDIFSRLEVHPDSGSSIRVVQDAERGRVWLFDKVGHEEDYRVESNGIVPNDAPPHTRYEDWLESEVYDISWSSRIPTFSEDTPENFDFVIFQFKSYPEGVQNYPFLFRVQKRSKLMYLDLIHSNAEGSNWIPVWSAPIIGNKWHDIRLRVRFSSDRTQGWLMLYFDDDIHPQLFQRNDSGLIVDPMGLLRCRTRDVAIHEGREVAGYPKWGVYNRGDPGTALAHFVDRLRIKKISGTASP